MVFVTFKELGGKVVVVVGAGVGESCGSGVKGERSRGSLRKVSSLLARV